VSALRVALVGACPYPTPQGSQVYLRGMARALAEAGQDVTVVAYAHGTGGADPGVRVVRGPALPGYARTRSGPDPAKPALDLALARVLAGVDGDVWHAHGHEGMGVALLARALRRARGAQAPPLVYTPHTRFGEELPTYLRGASWSHVALRSALATLGAASDRRLPAHADACVALSARSATHLRAHGGRVLATVTPGLFPEDVSPRAPLPPRPTVVYAGNPDAYQDLHVLTEAMLTLRATHGPGAPRLRLVGASWSSADGRAVAALADEVIDTPTWPVARAAIARAHVAVVPRTRCAGFPVKLLTAVALGVPAVVAEGSAQGLPGEVVVPNGEARALAEALQRTATTPPVVDTDALWRTCAWSVQVRALLEAYRAVRAG
jgi:glycosyltransferase involved in cell wall biosynthesis